MIYAAAVVAVILFAVTLRLSNAVQVAMAMLSDVRQSMAVLTAKHLSDTERERAARAASIKLFRYGIDIGARVLIALAVPAALLAGLIALHVFTMASLEDASLSWPLIVIAVLATIAGFYKVT